MAIQRHEARLVRFGGIFFVKISFLQRQAQTMIRHREFSLSFFAKLCSCFLQENIRGNQLLRPLPFQEIKTMPCLDKPLHELQAYTGTNPKPADFDEYWLRALRELDATDPKPELQPISSIRIEKSEAFDLTFTGVGGARIYAKYVRPKNPASQHPAILEFHGYAGNSGDWADKLRHSGEGVAVAAMLTPLNFQRYLRDHARGHAEREWSRFVPAKL